MRLNWYSVAVTTTGGDGAASGSGTIKLPVNGYIECIYLDYHADTHANTTVAISNAQTPPGGNVLAVGTNKTDGIYFPRAGCVSNANAAISNSYTRYPVSGDLTVAVTLANAKTACVTAYVGVAS